MVSGEDYTKLKRESFERKQSQNSRVLFWAIKSLTLGGELCFPPIVGAKLDGIQNEKQAEKKRRKKENLNESVCT